MFCSGVPGDRLSGALVLNASGGCVTTGTSGASGVVSGIASGAGSAGNSAGTSGVPISGFSGVAVAGSGTSGDPISGTAGTSGGGISASVRLDEDDNIAVCPGCCRAVDTKVVTTDALFPWSTFRLWPLKFILCFGSSISTAGIFLNIACSIFSAGYFSLSFPFRVA